MRRYAYSMRGTPRKFTFRGDRVNAVCAISTDGLLDFYTTATSVNSDKFLHFVEHAPVPHLQLFNGINKRNVVIMDMQPFTIKPPSNLGGKCNPVFRCIAFFPHLTAQTLML